jgi:tetratricopeptide (TPR) repeat protein
MDMSEKTSGKRRGVDDNLDFEIDFYKAIIEKSPDYVEALSVLGDAYTRKGLYRQGLEIDRRLTTLRPKDPVAHYNLACSYSLNHRKKEALASLRKSIKLGYNDIVHIATDCDLAPLHEDSAFHTLIQDVCKKVLGESGAIPTDDGKSKIQNPKSSAEGGSAYGAGAHGGQY